MSEQASAETVFCEALEKEPAERAAFLDRVCADNESLRREVESLLNAHQKVGPFLERPLVEAKGVADLSASETAPSDDALFFLAPSSEPGSLGRLDHYEVLEFVGKGSTGVVLRARDHKLLRVVAIKVLATSLASSGSARQRFAREARAAACVRDDHVIAIYAVEDRATVPYLVMEYIDGCTLDALLRRRGSLEVKEVLRIGIQVASGLSAAHKQGLIHRDVKPANILLENGVQRVKLTDFGLARAVDDASLTQSGFIAGTPLYMSPEQANGEPIDHRSDLFSLGSVLYEMCTGRPAFRAPNTAAVLRRVSDETPRSIREVNPDIPESICRMIEQLLAKNPADRPASAKEVSDQLAQLLADLQGQVSGGTSAATHLPSRESARDLASGQAQGRTLPSRLGRWAAVALVLLATSLALGDTTGVTNVRSTVIRLFSPEGTLVVEVDDPGVRVTVDGGDVVITNAGAGEIRLKPGQYKVEASKDGKLVRRELITVTRNGRQVVRLSQEAAPANETAQATPKLKKSLLGHTTGVLSVQYSPDGRLLASGDISGEVRVWDMPAGTLRYALPANGSRIHGLAFSPDGKFLVTSGVNGNPDIRIWIAETGKLDGVFKAHSGGMFEVSFSPDGKTLASVGWGPDIRVFDFAARSELRPIPTPDARWARSVAHSVDGSIAVGGGKLGLLGPAGQLLKTIDAEVGPLSFSPDGRLISGTTWKEGLVSVWDFKTAREIGTWRAQPGMANGVAFAPGGRALVTAGSDGSVRFWEIATQRLLGEVRHEGEVYQLAFSPDGGTLATTGKVDRLVKLWDVSFLRTHEAPEKRE